MDLQEKEEKDENHRRELKIIEDRTQEKHVSVNSRLKGHLDDRSKESVLQECNARV